MILRMKTRNFKAGLAFLAVISAAVSCQNAIDKNSRSGQAQPAELYDSMESPRTSEPPPPPTAQPEQSYNEIVENSFTNTLQAPVSTFSIDADGGSYANVRRFLENGQLPPADAVRIEELLNYFNFDYPVPNGKQPVAFDGEITECPWAKGHKLLRIGVKGQEIHRQALPPANFVLLVDVSGSMDSPEKLELLKDAFVDFAETLRPQDKLAIVTYSGEAGTVLKSTPGNQQKTIKNAIRSLNAGGGTNGEGGIQVAYQEAVANYIKHGNNRVILATDGDFNLGLSTEEALVGLIEEKRESGVFLTVLGVGESSFEEGKMEQLANHGNGSYEYLDNLEEAHKVLVEEFGEFYTVAKDVKIQLRFNPKLVKEYRLVGYENRLLGQEDFTDDRKDAGEIGAGQSITALYEIVPTDQQRSFSQKVATLTWLTGVEPKDPISTSAALRIDCRYKMPDGEKSLPLSLDLVAQTTDFDAASKNMQFATAVAAYGLLLRNSENKGDLTWKTVKKWAEKSGNTGFLVLVHKAANMNI